MEGTEEDNIKLISYTSASLDEQESKTLSVHKPLDASFATFLNYLEEFYESLESAIKEVEIIERSLGRSPTPLPKIKKQYEGQYQCGCDVFFFAMGYLIKSLYKTMRKGSELQLSSLVKSYPSVFGKVSQSRAGQVLSILKLSPGRQREREG